MVREDSKELLGEGKVAGEEVVDKDVVVEDKKFEDEVLCVLLDEVNDLELVLLVDSVVIGKEVVWVWVLWAGQLDMVDAQDVTA